MCDDDDDTYGPDSYTQLNSNVIGTIVISNVNNITSSLIQVIRIAITNTSTLITIHDQTFINTFHNSTICTPTVDNIAI